MAEENNKQKQEAGFMLKLATFIVDRRNLFFLIFGLLIIASIVGTRLVKVENRLTEYLSEDTETKQGLDLMNSQFETYGSCRLMIANITYDDAKKLADEIIKGASDNVIMPVPDEKISISIGIAIYQGVEKNYSELFKKADIALYKAKADKKNRFCIYE